MGKQETYQAARSRILAEFTAMGTSYPGLVVKADLVVPQVVLPCGETLLFKAQAVHTKSNGLSTWLDIRGMSARSLQYKTQKTRSMQAAEYFESK